MKCFLDVFQHSPALVDDDGDDVEAYLQVDVMAEQIPFGSKDQVTLLAEIDGR